MSVSRAAIINVSAVLGSIGQNNVGRNYGYRMSKVFFVFGKFDPTITEFQVLSLGGLTKP